MDVVVAVPVKPFDRAKQRLSDILDPDRRSRLSMALAERTVAAASASRAIPLVLSADALVTEWARSIGVEVVLDPGSSLSAAAAGAVTWASDRRSGWIVCHADLPLVKAADLSPIVAAVAAGRSVLTPSTDGGTNLIGSRLAGFEFSYGVGSFHRHLVAFKDPIIISSTALSLDLDEPNDLEACLRHPDGMWLKDVLATR